jgi:hypothetical protein
MNGVVAADPPRADPAVVAELGLDRYGLRPVLERLGVRYVRAEPGEEPA